MKSKVLTASLVTLVGLAGQADVDWKYDTSGRVGKYVAESTVTVSHAAAYEGRPSVCVQSPAVVPFSGFFETRTVFEALKSGLNLNFNAPGFVLFFR